MRVAHTLVRLRGYPFGYRLCDTCLDFKYWLVYLFASAHNKNMVQKQWQIEAIGYHFLKIMALLKSWFFQPAKKYERHCIRHSTCFKNIYENWIICSLFLNLVTGISCFCMRVCRVMGGSGFSYPSKFSSFSFLIFYFVLKLDNQTRTRYNNNNILTDKSAWKLQ